MSYIKRSSIEDVIATARIEEVIAKFEILVRQGANFSIQGNDSLKISPSKNIYKDFATDEAGNAVAYLQKQQGKSFKEAIIFLAEMYNITLEYEQTNQENREADLKRESLMATLQTAQQYFTIRLQESKEALSYLQSRGITHESIERFAIGYAPDNWTGLLDYASKYHSLQNMQDTFLIKEKEDKKTHYDRYRNRITFALQSRTGEILGYTGRILGQPSKEVAKYINPTDTETYSKAKFLYGLYQAQSIIKQKNEAYIVEGQTDVILMHQLDVCNTIALSGLSISLYQLKVLQNLCKRITLVLDGDKAGDKGVNRLLHILLHAGFDVRIVRLPEGEDPASYCQKFIEQNAESAALEIKNYLFNHSKNFLAYNVAQYKNSLIDQQQAQRIGEAKTKSVELENQKNLLLEQIEVLKLDLPILRDEEYKEAKEDYQAKTKQIGEITRLTKEAKDFILEAEAQQKNVEEDLTKRAEFANYLAQLVCALPDETLREGYKKEAIKNFEELKKYKWKEEETKQHPQEEEEEEQDTNNIIYQLRRYIQRNLHLRISTIDNEVQGKLRSEKFTTNIDDLKALNPKTFIPVDDTALKVDLQEKGYTLPEKTLTDFLKVGIPRFNVFEEYFGALKCDGDLGYFDYFYKTLNMAKKDLERFAKLFPNWLSRVVATAIDNKFYNKQCLMFMGPQNIGKSSICNWFAPPALNNYITSTVDITTKDGTIALCQNLFINLEEFDRQPYQYVATMKAYMAMVDAKVRPPFEKKSVKMSRRASFVGNTNEATFLKDIQGGSVRWLCFPLLGAPDWSIFNKVDIDRLYALAYLAYKKAEEQQSWKSIEMSPAQIAENNQENRKYAEFTEEMYYLSEVFRPVPMEAITDDMVEAGNVFFKNATSVAEEIRKYFYITEHRDIKLSSKRMGEALQFFGYLQGKFKRYTHKDLYVYALAYADKTQNQPQGFYEGE